MDGFQSLSSPTSFTMDGFGTPRQGSPCQASPCQASPRSLAKPPSRCNFRIKQNSEPNSAFWKPRCNKYSKIQCGNTLIMLCSGSMCESWLRKAANMHTNQLEPVLDKLIPTEEKERTHEGDCKFGPSDRWIYTSFSICETLAFCANVICTTARRTLGEVLGSNTVPIMEFKNKFGYLLLDNSTHAMLENKELNFHDCVVNVYDVVLKFKTQRRTFNQYKFIFLAFKKTSCEDFTTASVKLCKLNAEDLHRIRYTNFNAPSSKFEVLNAEINQVDDPLAHYDTFQRISNFEAIKELVGACAYARFSSSSVYAENFIADSPLRNTRFVRDEESAVCTDDEFLDLEPQEDIKQDTPFEDWTLPHWDFQDPFFESICKEDLFSEFVVDERSSHTDRLPTPEHAPKKARVILSVRRTLLKKTYGPYQKVPRKRLFSVTYDDD